MVTKLDRLGHASDAEERHHRGQELAGWSEAVSRGDRVSRFDLRELLRDHPCDGPDARAFAEG